MVSCVVFGTCTILFKKIVKRLVCFFYFRGALSSVRARSFHWYLEFFFVTETHWVFFLHFYSAPTYNPEKRTQFIKIKLHPFNSTLICLLFVYYSLFQFQFSVPPQQWIVARALNLELLTYIPHISGCCKVVLCPFRPE